MGKTQIVLGRCEETKHYKIAEGIQKHLLDTFKVEDRFLLRKPKQKNLSNREALVVAQKSNRFIGNSVKHVECNPEDISPQHPRYPKSISKFPPFSRNNITF